MESDDNKLIEELYIRLYETLMLYSRSLLPCEALAEEAIQETFWIACNRMEELCASPNPEGWILVTLKNVICNMRRSRARATMLLREYAACMADTCGITWDRENVELLYGSLADTEAFRIVKAVALDGKSVRELAKEYGISVPACHKRIQRAKMLLRKAILK